MDWFIVPCILIHEGDQPLSAWADGFLPADPQHLEILMAIYEADAAGEGTGTIKTCPFFPRKFLRDRRRVVFKLRLNLWLHLME